ncbi:MAG: hypothetical protein ACK5KK_09825 [Microbacterium sp.]
MTGALWIVALALGSAAQLPFEVTRQDSTYQPWGEVMPIFVNNLAVGLALYSGVISFGAISIAMTFFAGIYIGSIVGLAVDAWGLGGAFDAFWPFLLFEVAGFMAFTFGGLLPVFRVGRLLQSSSAPSSRTVSGGADIAYRAAAQVAASLPFAGVGAVLLAGGAVLEVAGGLPR